jgi:hypothetical protein
MSTLPSAFATVWTADAAAVQANQSTVGKAITRAFTLAAAIAGEVMNIWRSISLVALTVVILGAGIQTDLAQGPPIITKVFGATTIPVNGTTALTFIIENPNPPPLVLTGVAFTDALPAGLVVATPADLIPTP